MSAATGTIPPPVSWAQRNDLVYVIIDVECNNVEHKVTETSLHFQGVNALDASKKYDVTLNFYNPVDPERVTSKNIGRCLEFTIHKKTPGPYWPSLTNDKTKLHFLKANFTKWRDEDDEEEAGNRGNDIDMSNPSFWNEKFDDFNDDDDSDDNIPSLTPNDEDGDGDDDEKETKDETKKE